MATAWNLAKTCIEKAQKSQKTQYDKKVTKTSDDFRVGDKVFVYTPNPKKGLSPKLQSLYKGPQRIIELSDTNAKVIMLNSPRSKPQWVHLNRCKIARTQQLTSHSQNPNTTI